ncbi:DNA cross-link repair protein pso2/snm1 [Madurella mycetomatis]|uniref:DNA cross-link repair protein pso2/snm1 n=1 Tax=Madurella mycetomatis TaxID=100816 RepID=A0A175VTN1_9PEZI|nr:DNA cross-link repair protein pso2/snm1 [Madurella mycetomatis]
MVPSLSNSKVPRKGPTSTTTAGRSTPSRKQSKLSFTPKTPSSSSANNSKTKPRAKPNQSILNFFKKAPAADEGLFIGEGGAVAEVNGDDEQDIYDGPSREEEARFNEAGGPVKRRRLSNSTALSSSSGREDADEGLGITDVKPAATPAAQKKKRPGNPFLDDDSSSDEEESDNHRGGGSMPTANRVRSSSPPLFDDTSGEQSRGRGPAKLTNGSAITREVPLPRQQTSRDELGNENECSSAKDASISDDFAFEAEEFTGEELDAMRYMEAQARIEASEEEEEDLERNYDGEAMTENCPVCNGGLAGATTEQATAHVNSCLDGNPTPLPKPPDNAIIEGTAMGKRLPKVAIARPGQANPIRLGGDSGEAPSASAFAKLMSGHAEDAAWATAAAAENASRGMPAYKRTCPFYKIMPGFSICVDAFRYGAVEGCKAYFLSHFHSDHYMGLTANWMHGPIYCSKVTGSLVKSQLKTAAKYVVELEFEKTVPVPETTGVTVTMIPANHCPGSSLFLFEKAAAGGRSQRILHCGDFRACPAHVEHPQLRPETVDAISGRTKQQKIDVCYLDTTYLNPRYSFPPQGDVISACAEICALLNKALVAGDDSEWEALLRRQKRGGAGPAGTENVSKFFTTTTSSTSSASSLASERPPARPNDAFASLKPPSRNRLLVVCGTYSIGKERICVAIAQALNTKIYAAPAKIRMCQQLDDPELAALLTPNPREAQVHMQMLMEIRAETLAEYLETYNNSFARIVGFRPSGWNYRPSASASASAALAGTTPPSGSSTNLLPASLPTTQLLHGPRWRTRFATRDLVPQRGSGKAAMCFGVPYSEHSSFRELALFLMALRIEKVVPTVNVGSEGSRRRMKGWIERWLGERRRGGLVRVLKEDDQGEKPLWEGKDGKGGGVYW